MIRQDSDGWMSLAEALRKAAVTVPHVAQTALRKAVVKGEIPYRRSSHSKGARFYVQWPQFKQYLNELSKPRSKG